MRIEDDAIRWDLIHTLVVATQTVDSAGPGRPPQGARRRPARTATRSSARAPRTSAEAEIVRDLASTLAELYRAEIDATGQPMSPDPFHAVKNAIEHYRIDEVLISTFAGESSRWLEEDLIGRVREITDKPVEHIEVGRPAAGRRRRRGRGRGGLMESATVAVGHGHARSTTARRRPTRARGSTARRSGSCSSSSPR